MAFVTSGGSAVLPDVNYNKLIADRPGVRTQGLDFLSNLLKGGSLNVNPLSAADPRYANIRNLAFGQGLNAGSREGTNLINRVGAGGEGRAALLRAFGRASGTQMGLQGAQAQANADTAVMEGNANRALSGANSYVSADLGTTAAERARYNDVLDYINSARADNALSSENDYRNRLLKMQEDQQKRTNALQDYYLRGPQPGPGVGVFTDMSGSADQIQRLGSILFGGSGGGAGSTSPYSPIGREATAGYFNNTRAANTPTHVGMPSGGGNSGMTAADIQAYRDYLKQKNQQMLTSNPIYSNRVDFTQ